MIVIVSGAGRCGSSAIMHMLAAAGIPPSCGQHPKYLDPRYRAGRHNDWIERCDGQAVKAMMPWQTTFPACDYLGIWCYREPADMAASHVRQLAQFGVPMADEERRRHERYYATNFAYDQQRGLAILANICLADPLIVRYDELRRAPLAVAADICRHLSITRITAPTEMAACITAAPVR